MKLVSEKTGIALGVVIILITAAVAWGDVQAKVTDLRDWRSVVSEDIADIKEDAAVTRTNVQWIVRQLGGTPE